MILYVTPSINSSACIIYIKNIDREFDFCSLHVIFVNGKKYIQSGEYKC
jgi:hypothetical protein